eukprot:3258091-Rhodomonas_salina.1
MVHNGAPRENCDYHRDPRAPPLTVLKTPLCPANHGGRRRRLGRWCWGRECSGSKQPRTQQLSRLNEGTGDHAAGSASQPLAVEFQRAGAFGVNILSGPGPTTRRSWV